jgi:putative selenium metabolism protein SsnA
MNEQVEPRAMVIYGGPVFDGVSKIYHEGAVYVSDGLIQAIGTEEEIFRQIPKNINLDYFDASDRVVFPGLINLHHHFYSALAKGLAPRGPVQKFTDRLANLWWKLDKALDLELVQLSALLSILDSIWAGVTTVFDHHASPFDLKGSLEVIAAAVERSGLRTVLCYEISDRDGAEIFLRGLAENLEFIEKYFNHPQIRGTLGLHANFTLSDDSLAAVAAQFDPAVGLHIHCAEDKADVDFCRMLGYAGPVDRLHNFGLLSPKSILAHGVHLNAKERQRLAATQAVLVHNPESNANNGVGRLDLTFKEGLLVGLGTDGMSSHMLHTLRSAFLLHRQAGIPDDTLFQKLQQLLVENNPAVAARFFNSKPGVLEKGAAADLVVFDYIPVTPFNEKTLTSHLLYGMYQAEAALVMVQGKVIYTEGSFLTLDEKLIYSEAREASKRLWRRFEKV